jgi:trimethyllysine dioxygenase
VTDTPVTPEATEALLSKIGPIRHTHYGGFYDFTPDMAKADTAYTNIALPAHTDNTYFTDPAGLQAFHMLSHIAPKGSDPAGGNLGGQSLLVDGFHAAEVMREQHPEAFEVLCSTGIPWHASGNEGIVIIPDRNYPVIELAEGSESTISRIRWNNADRGTIPHTSSKQVNEWYDAARLFDGLLRHPDNEFWFQLQPGTVLSKSTTGN